MELYKLYKLHGYSLRKGVFPTAKIDLSHLISGKRLTDFKTTVWVLGMLTVAIPTAGKNSGWSLLRTVVEGQQMNVLAPDHVGDMCTRAEFIAAAYFPRLLDDVGWTIVHGAWNAEPYQRYGALVNFNEASGFPDTAERCRKLVLHLGRKQRSWCQLALQNLSHPGFA